MKEREVKGIEVKGVQRKILVKSPEPENKAQRKFKYKNYHAITMRRNYEEKLSKEIIKGNYQRKLSKEIIKGNYKLVYQSREKCEIYRDTEVSKNQNYTLENNIFLLIREPVFKPGIVGRVNRGIIYVSSFKGVKSNSLGTSYFLDGVNF